MNLKPTIENPFEEIVPDLYRYHGDCCAVYVLREDDTGVLIDLGSGAVLDELEQIGVRRVEGVYLTHAHRDQCQGADRLAGMGIPLHVPAGAESFVRKEKRMDFLHSSPLLQKFPGSRLDPPRPIPNALFDVRPGQTIQFGRFALDVVACPGHCDHQVTYSHYDDQHHIVFCGDEIHSEGKLHAPYHLERDHYTGTGARQAADSLRVLRLLYPNIVCPSHGPVFRGNTWSYFLNTEDEIEKLARLKDSIVPGCGPSRRLLRPRSPRIERLTDHLLSWLNSFFVLSDQGGALMVDAGNLVSDEFWREFERASGGREIEAILISHYHCDHHQQAANVKRKFPKAQVWVHRNLVPILERPHDFRRPFLAPKGLQVDRALGEAETAHWHEYAITSYFLPAQTDLHACYETHIDGRHVLFTGDDFYPAQQWGGTGGLSGLNGGHPRNGWRRSIQLILDINPDWIVCSHTQPFAYDRAHFETALEWTEAVARQMERIAPDGNLERHHNPHFIHFFPYVQRVGPERECTVTARIQNTYHERKAVTARLVAPDGWDVSPCEDTIHIAPDTVGEIAFTLKPPSRSSGRQMLTLDVLYDGEYLGEMAECYVDS